MIIKLDDFTDGFYIGQSTLDLVEDFVSKEFKKGNKQIIIDCSNPKFSIRKEFLLSIAKIEEYYNAKFYGLQSKEEIVSSIRNSGFFTKDKIGNLEYGKKFRKIVEMADFPLMIKDNRNIEDKLIRFNVIQPISFDDNYFYYNTIKPYLLEPIKLEEACWKNNQPIWDENKIFISDIGDFNQGFRFASNKKERTILDIFTKIIEGDLSISFK